MAPSEMVVPTKCNMKTFAEKRCPLNKFWRSGKGVP